MCSEEMTKGELTRQTIIAKAAPLFNQLGYAGCSIQDVMRVTGLEKGGLYRHFASKEELATEVFQYSARRVLGARLEGLEKIDGSTKKLRFFIDRFVEIQSTIPGGCPVMNTAIEADDGNPALRKLVQQAVRQWKESIAAIVRTGIEKGEIRAETEPRRVANVIISALEGALMISRLEGNRNAMHDVQVVLREMLGSIESRSKINRR